MFLTGCSAGEAIQAGVDAVMGDIPADDPVDVETVSADKIAYGQLSTEAKKTYDQMLDAIEKYKKEVTLSTKSTKIMDLAMEALLADHAGIFWMDGYTYHTYQRGDHVVGLTFEPRYTLSREDKERYQKRVDDVAGEWLSELSADAGDYEKSKYIFETLINHVDYDKNAKNNQNILSVFVGGATVCQGYAEATSYLLGKVGISSMVVSGTANGEAHAWNYVALDHEGYLIDTTWGNSRYRGQEDEKKHVNYAYLNVRSRELERTHTVDMQVNVPACISSKNSYYHQEGLYFDTYAEERIGNTFADAYYAGKPDISVKFATDEDFEQAEDYFLAEGHLGEYCPGVGSVSYIASEDMNVITIEFK